MRDPDYIRITRAGLRERFGEDTTRTILERMTAGDSNTFEFYTGPNAGFYHVTDFYPRRWPVVVGVLLVIGVAIALALLYLGSDDTTTVIDQMRVAEARCPDGSEGESYLANADCRRFHELVIELERRGVCMEFDVAVDCATHAAYKE